MTGEELLKMRDYLAKMCKQYDDSIHVMVAQRKNGKCFTLEDHIAGLVYAQLTNQTKWSRIVPHLKEIDNLFFSYDVEKIKGKSLVNCHKCLIANYTYRRINMIRRPSLRYNIDNRCRDPA